MSRVWSQEGSSRLLTNAVRHGLVKPCVPSLKRDLLTRKLGGYLLAHKRTTKDPDLQRPYQNPKSQVYHEHSFDAVLQPDGAPLPQWVVELARFPVPFGHIGILKTLEQYLYNNQQTITQSANWGIPYQVNNVGAVSWHLRLEPFTGIQPPRYNNTGNAWLPGQPFAELPDIQHFWYPATSPGIHLNALIPGGYMLRFFFYAPEDIIGRVRVMGRLRGFTQYSYNKEAAWNARTNW